MWAVSIYLAGRRKNFMIAFVPALFMTAVVSAYLFVAKETLGLSSPVSYVLALAVTAVCAFFFLRWRSRLATVPASAGDAVAGVRQDSVR